MDAATWLADRAFGKAVAQVETKSLNVDMGLSDISTEELLELLLGKCIMVAGLSPDTIYKSRVVGKKGGI